MPTSFPRGKITGPDDLYIQLEKDGTPVDPHEITYSLYEVTDQGDVVIGQPNRDPIRHELGYYYAKFQIPQDANLSLYRVRWRIKRTSGSDYRTAMEEFEVEPQEAFQEELYGERVSRMIMSLRRMLRDNCLDGEEEVTIRVDGEVTTIALCDLYNILEDNSMDTSDIKQAFESGELEVKSMDDEGDVKWETIENIHRVPASRVGWRKITTSEGDLVCTENHKIYTGPGGCAPANMFRNGDVAYGVRGDDKTIRVVSSEVVDPRPYAYDITVSNTKAQIHPETGIKIHNSPDRNYHFRPPTSEGTINDFNQAFGYIWEDAELVEYMERALDRINLYPPETHFGSLDDLIQTKPAWRQMVLMGAIASAAMALQFNWIADDFSYSIGGISLDIDKASKYDSIKSNAQDQFQEMLEKKQDTVKITRGLKQSRYGIGVRSSFGPHLDHGVLSPRKYVGI